ncbi:C2 domain-containing protein [Cryptosporidium andersoni]|uniref:C2 domain-containing protein n=1 Tax=Cryptosporidium andersoni TaxID=117008 RepID=A0A1J4MRJ1_9CRYT|nr:C2 domain-containing protein [Cryptosporidium andersoni]
MWNHPQFYNVIVEIVEVQNLVWPTDIALSSKKSASDAKLPNPLVEVTIKGDSYATESKEATSSCAFNKTFYFQQLLLNWDEFQRATVEIRVLHQGFFRQELIGMYTGSFEKIYGLPSHRLLKTLVPITIPERPSIPLGYIRLSIYVLGENDVVNPEDSYIYGSESYRGAISSIPSSLPVPELDITYYHLNFNVHLARSILLPDYTDLTHQEADGYSPNPFVRIVTLDNALETAVVKSSSSPVWNETLKFPVGLPCLDDRIVLELWDAQGGGDGPRLVAQTKLSLQDIFRNELTPTWLHFYGQTTGLRGNAINIKDIAMTAKVAEESGDHHQITSLVTSFQNSFAVLSMFDNKYTASYPCIAYLGRLLVSANLTRVANPTPIKIPCNPVDLPSVSPYLFWVDIYELSGLGLPADVYIELSLGSWCYWIIPNTKIKISDSFPLDTDIGRIPDQVFALPDIDMSADLLIRIFTRDESQDRAIFHSYIRIPARDMLKYGSERPKWYPLLSAAHYGIMIGQDLPYDQAVALAHIKHYGMLLGSFILRKKDTEYQYEEDYLNKYSINTRPSRIQYNLRRWICRAYIFQAIRIPAVESTLPDPVVMVTLGGGTVLTEVIPKTVNPDWHEALVFDAALPDDLSVAQWLNIAILHEDIVLGSVAISPLYIGFMKKNRPEWFILQTPRIPECKARILCTFELIKLGDISSSIFSSVTNIITDVKKEYSNKTGNSDLPLDDANWRAWYVPDATPTYIPCDIHLFLIGIRLRSQCDNNGSSLFSMGSSTKPLIQLEFGRDPEKPENRLWVEQASEPYQGDAGKYNYLQDFCLKCHIPASPIFQTYLEVRILEPITVFSGKYREFGTAYIHLNHHLPWIDEYNQRLLKNEFQYIPPNMATHKWLRNGKRFLSKYYKDPWKIWTSDSANLFNYIPKTEFYSTSISPSSSLITLPDGNTIRNIHLNDDSALDFYSHSGYSNTNKTSSSTSRNEFIKNYCEDDNEDYINIEKNDFQHGDFFDIFYEPSNVFLINNDQFSNRRSLLSGEKFELNLKNIIQDFFFKNHLDMKNDTKLDIKSSVNNNKIYKNNDLLPLDYLGMDRIPTMFYEAEEDALSKDPNLQIPIHDLEALNSCITSMESYVKPLYESTNNDELIPLKSENIYKEISKKINWGISPTKSNISASKKLFKQGDGLDWFFAHKLQNTNSKELDFIDDDDYTLDNHDISDEQDELGQEYELELDMDDLPYDSVPIISANKFGEIEVVGFLKVYCRILSRSKFKNKQENKTSNLSNDGIILQTPKPKQLPLSKREYWRNSNDSSINYDILSNSINSEESTSPMNRINCRRYSLSSINSDDLDINNNQTNILPNISTKITKSSDIKNNRNYYYDPLLEYLKKQIAEIPRLKIRAYILTGHGFVPPKIQNNNALTALSNIKSTKSDEGSWYLNLKTGHDQIGNSSNGIFEINDSENFVQGFSPEFYKTYILDALLPTNALLSITVMYKNNNLNQSYGRTYIDIEDRFFHPRYQKILSNPNSILPIEIRQLYPFNDQWNYIPTNYPVGSLRCWFHILPPEISLLRPIYLLNPPTTEICQVRVVIYKLRNIPISELINTSGVTNILSFGGPAISLMVKGLMSPNSNSILEFDTDTHWNSHDGTATFNWRFVFNIPVPCQFPILRLQVWNRGLIVFGDALSECTLDLSNELMRSRKSYSCVKINRSWINLTHPARLNEKRGEMEIEISILPLSIAESKPVGIGRDEPNRDPYLPDVTDHRNYITTSAFGRGFFSATTNIKWGAKIFTWIITAIVIITILMLLIKLFK